MEEINKEKRFDVVIIKDTTGEVVSTIGRNLSEKRAERRVDTGWARIDYMNFSVEMRECK